MRWSHAYFYAFGAFSGALVFTTLPVALGLGSLGFVTVAVTVAGYEWVRKTVRADG